MKIVRLYVRFFEKFTIQDAIEYEGAAVHVCLIYFDFKLGWFCHAHAPKSNTIYYDVM